MCATPNSDRAILDHIQHLRSTIPPHVRLIAVTKTIPVATMRLAYQAGIRDFGENRVQEAIAKQAELTDLPDLTWHLIGHLQRNKARQALEHFHWIHSIDSLALATRLNQLAQELGRSPRICLQVKLRPDPAKTGWLPADLLVALPLLETLTALQVSGLMTIPPAADLDPKEILNIFHETQELARKLQGQRRSGSTLNFQELSMGMSSDYPLGIQAGSTMVRLGRILFGDRPG